MNSMQAEMRIKEGDMTTYVVNSFILNKETYQRWKMEEMLKKGYSMQEVLEHLQNSHDTKTELAKKIKKLSGGRKLSNEDMISLIKEQLGEEEAKYFAHMRHSLF